MITNKPVSNSEFIDYIYSWKNGRHTKSHNLHYVQAEAGDTNDMLDPFCFVSIVNRTYKATIEDEG